jgi:NAD-dependent dihydropyrimidine dehydrogenase PreA subunit/flavodoxin
LNNDKADIVIFYFSGTGNTWWVSQELVRQFDKLGRTARAYSIEAVNAEEAAALIGSASLTGFGYPIHGSDLPLPMKDFIKSLPEGAGQQAFVFCTQWLWSGDGASVGGTMLHEKGFKVQWGEHFLMPNNVTVSIISLPYSNDYARLNNVLARASRAATFFAGEIIAGRPFLHGFSQVSFYLGCLQRLPFRRVYHKLQNDIGIDQENCIDCGECLRLCPVDNFYYEGDQIKTKGSCILCLRCYNFCPVAAITHMGRPHLHSRGEPYKGPVKDFDPTILMQR